MTDEGVELPLGETRARVLQWLRARPGPATVAEAAEAIGLHANTVRFHLDALTVAGLAERQREAREQPGRPKVLYAAASGATGVAGVARDRGSYRMLSEILLAMVAESVPSPTAEAERAGERWGRYLAPRPAPYRETTAAGGVAMLLDKLDELGFAPEVGEDGWGCVALRRCPFRAEAERHGDIVCAVHLGLTRGLLAGVEAPVEVTGLEPFVEPDLCLTHLAAT